MTQRSINPNGIVLWEGPSVLDGKPTVAIATGLTVPSSNPKTRGMWQIFVLRSDLSPHQAVLTGADNSVCGDCPERHFLGGRCFVTPFHHNSVYTCFRSGGYRKAELAELAELAKGAKLRFTQYGDAAAVPAHVWRALMPKAKHAHTGYTHQWRRPDAQYLRHILMASVASEAQHGHAKRLGWRTFRIMRPGEQPSARSVQCLEPTRGLTCTECLICDGTAKGERKADVWIAVHGARKNSNPLLPIAA